MANKSEKTRSDDSPEQKMKQKDNKRDIDPQREQVDTEVNKDSEKNPDDFEQ
ncbi:hypothetical protein SAMN05421743_102305 [Thalassobacillus cyri]|uniref:Uncharacterized protein n=1 Tax=Thalassobacillus cyri TaxID=571932 RepID=A0A1H3Y0N7_9BACI|nr:hypothetical protein [Thalassobacillus cyri]SEA04424.1 hypothetical protein SAMN05421743_102305 [Thalassobacillus cyri]